MEKSIIIIPVRAGSVRLPNKFLEKINNIPLMVWVLNQAKKSGIRVVLACDDDNYMEVAKNFGFESVMTSTSHNSGTDRIAEAVNILDPEGKIMNVINVQGDMPFINPETIQATLKILEEGLCDIATAAVVMKDKNDAFDRNVVKIALAENSTALYFSRSPIPHEAEEYLYHLGIYAFKRDALEKFVSLPQSNLEKMERLEQLRAMENNMIIKVVKLEDTPISVDTYEDLQKAKEFAKSF